MTAKEPDMTSELVDVKYVGKRVRCRPDTVRTMLKQKRIPPAFKLGRAWLWHKGVIEQWIANGCPSNTQ